jgi:hypothetical protein
MREEGFKIRGPLQKGTLAEIPFRVTPIAPLRLSYTIALPVPKVSRRKQKSYQLGKVSRLVELSGLWKNLLGAQKCMQPENVSPFGAIRIVWPAILTFASPRAIQFMTTLHGKTVAAATDKAKPVRQDAHLLTNLPHLPGDPPRPDAPVPRPTLASIPAPVRGLRLPLRSRRPHPSKTLVRGARQKVSSSWPGLASRLQTPRFQRSRTRYNSSRSPLT